VDDVVAYSANVVAKKENQGGNMFTELVDELFDLEATSKGYGGALYANVDPGGGGSSCSCNLVLCCCCSQICW
jgi:hypothetical protein